MRRKKISYRKSKKLFKKTHSRIHKKNLKVTDRGGIRL